MGRQREVRELIEQAERQGWRSDRRKSGRFLLFSPDGKTVVTIHGTPSDRNCRKAAIRR